MFFDATSPNVSFVKLQVYKGKRLWGKVDSPVIIKSCLLFTLRMSKGFTESWLLLWLRQGNVPGLVETKPGAMAGVKIHEKIKLPQREEQVGSRDDDINLQHKASGYEKQRCCFKQ